MWLLGAKRLIMYNEGGGVCRKGIYILYRRDSIN